MMPRWTKLIVAAGLLTAGLFPTASEAQMGSKPFAFRNSGGGIGISEAGKQAIINRQLSGATPDVLLRGADGTLLSVQRGPGGVPIVTTLGGQVLPSYRGRSLNQRRKTGVFNAYFLGNRDGSYPQYIEASATRTAIDSWTSSVIYGVPSSSGGSSVDQWTQMVYLLDSH